MANEDTLTLQPDPSPLISIFHLEVHLITSSLSASTHALDHNILSLACSLTPYLLVPSTPQEYTHSSPNYPMTMHSSIRSHKIFDDSNYVTQDP